MATPITSPIPTNIITGFLGSGKTTLIQNLLAQKPENERWAVLVNEFGEIGIDGKLLEKSPENFPPENSQQGNSQQGNNQKKNHQQEIFIREVPGGCMCCSSGIPMQIALNQLITKANPHRLIIEPTGLGHPKEVIAELSAQHNSAYLDLKAVITLIDARKLVQPKYHKHPIYSEQLAVSDVIVANKSDLYQPDDIQNMKSVLETLDLSNRPLQLTSHGQLASHWLQQPVGSHSDLPHVHSHAPKNQIPEWQTQLQEHGFACTKNQKEDFYTEGWIFNQNYIFDFNYIYSFLSGIEAERVKGVFITEKGVFGFNKVDDVLSYSELEECDDTRVEFIFNTANKSQSEPEMDINTILMQALKTRIT